VVLYCPVYAPVAPARVPRVIEAHAVSFARSLFPGVQIPNRKPWRPEDFADLYGVRRRAQTSFKHMPVAGAAEGAHQFVRLRVTLCPRSRELSRMYMQKLCHEAIAWRQLAHAHVHGLTYLGINTTTFASTNAD
jgi:hypothetical protein